MKAVVITPGGTPESLRIEERPKPIPGPDQVRIRVKAAGINRPDIFQRKGHYPAPPGVVPDIPGLEVSGVIEAIGSEVCRWKTGDRVCALLPGGGYAEYAIAEASVCLPLPIGMDYKEAACLPETVFTVWHNLFQRGGLQASDRVLIHGGSGGIGTTAIQLASLYADQVFTTAGSEVRCRNCEDLGAVIAINYHEQDYASVLESQGVTLILDSIGGNYFKKNLNILRPDGRLVHINAVQGSEVDLNLWILMQKRITLTGSTLRGRDIDFKSKLAGQVEEKVWPLIDKGFFKPILDAVFSFEQAHLAHHHLEDGKAFGKVVLTW